MKISDLIQRLQHIQKDFKEAEVLVWMPGTYIELEAVFGINQEKVLIEGNVKRDA